MVSNYALNATAKKYRPSLSSLMQLCEHNYLMLTKLLLNKNQDVEKAGDQYCFFIAEHLNYSITVKEVTRYTSLVHIVQNQPFSNDTSKNSIDKMLLPSMIIRLYHDARMAEVNSSQNIRFIKPRYDYPNKKMHLPDEKQQVNQFLKEWLQLCLQHGQVAVDLTGLAEFSLNSGNNKLIGDVD